ncbi:hypothetical protein JYU34_009682 [Plutella xylostella]|uniref:Uncharacterized protein n=1 Tax=Plutella xylostella TaxID=51655 RepID=A0ABQ7QLE5_PLUXY|nr:hypothetical protein JYU34_009682 [Plutella xylostella]
MAQQGWSGARGEARGPARASGGPGGGPGPYRRETRGWWPSRVREETRGPGARSKRFDALRATPLRAHLSATG